MDARELLIELFGRVDEHVRVVLDDLDPAWLAEMVEPGANTIGWQVWHLTRVQDHHVAELLDAPQVWSEEDWASRFGLAPGAEDTGYGHTAAEMASIVPDGIDVLRDYFEAVAGRTRAFLSSVAPDDLSRIVDRRWDPPVTMGVRLVSVADDDIQHAAQAAFARGVLERRSR